MRKYYLSQLKDVVMVDPESLAAQRLGGADFDGDMIKTIADNLLNECVKRNYEYDDLNDRSNLLYAEFSKLSPGRIFSIRSELTEQLWHLMDKDTRRDFLTDFLPEYADFFDLLADFRFGGYRVLGDLICDIDDENNATERKNSSGQTIRRSLQK